MKITGTQIVEQRIIKVFSDSRKQDNEEKCIEAQIIVKKVLRVFKLISVFENFDHLEVVKKLYFSKNNIEILGINKMAEKLYMDAKTLYRLRKKYCAVIVEILNSIDFKSDK